MVEVAPEHQIVVSVPIAKCTLTGTAGADGSLIPVRPGIPLSDYLHKNTERFERDRLDMAAKDSEFTYIRQVVIGLRLPQWM